jgi:hypothetical protein
MHFKWFNPKNGGYKREKTSNALPCAHGLIRYNQPRQNEALPPSLIISLSSRARRGVFFSPVYSTPVPEAFHRFCVYKNYAPIVIYD